MHLPRGVVVVTQGNLVGRVQKVLTENRRSVNFYEPKIQRFLCREFDVSVLREATEEDEARLRRLAVEHNRKLAESLRH
jgi:hypothetical protein